MAAATKGVFIVAAKRTPFGSMCGKLSNKTPTDLAEIAAKAALASGKIDPKIIDSAVIGNCISAASNDATYLARHVLLRCGAPIDRPALVINRLCGSGFQAVINAAHEIHIGDSKVVMAGGAENMSLAPHLLKNIRAGVKFGMDLKLEDSLWGALTDAYCKTPMGLTADNLADKFKISRKEAEEYAFASHQKWKAAFDKGVFKEEIVPVKIKVKGQEVMMEMDEHPKPKTTLEGLAKLPSVFKKGGAVTAGTASGINDGAGIMIVASEAAVKEHNLKPLARLVSYGVAGCEPSIMGIGPVPAVQKALKVAGMTTQQINIWEINEAFAPQAISCAKDLQIDPKIINPNGGAIAIGHPLAASGARITAHLCHEMKRTGAKFSCGSACIGGGQGIALILEKC